jgi:hypothetical protein
MPTGIGHISRAVEPSASPKSTHAVPRKLQLLLAVGCVPNSTSLRTELVERLYSCPYLKTLATGWVWFSQHYSRVHVPGGRLHQRYAQSVSSSTQENTCQGSWVTMQLLRLELRHWSTLLRLFHHGPRVPMLPVCYATVSSVSLLVYVSVHIPIVVY